MTGWFVFTALIGFLIGVWATWGLASYQMNKEEREKDKRIQSTRLSGAVHATERHELRINFISDDIRGTKQAISVVTKKVEELWRELDCRVSRLEDAYLHQQMKPKRKR